ncbi:hypothetical protein A2716_03755 [candidate division WWE3 bacterium RIFCSPHIGHO2_01_FULL_40_23]|uniref:Glycosyltransferase 2-like domain-containing protein n=1 Tax=candidate division WWE3 bacterium RIFCSPLOWO2_01_FULL_41_18 TaxID=1802625 RepID=A0A1F4VCV7_UNCKA|nr:MAG: hypothetical protein A2716_03755 [candidate division WWE3 bacterium RIFCSPHIGHO2_01_FULL_40_23]OGC54994.1 MAG: hypothetical protein A3A78_03365 [candidate division WWE3 bacterium RIFCSPLOWO2_01_FULL_41_18]
MLFDSTKNVNLSIIVPIYNEEKNIIVLYKELKEVLKESGRSYEIIMVDDGSFKDRTWDVLSELAQNDKSLKVIQHSRNYGLTAAYQNGFDHSKGDYVIIIASDLEVNTNEILNVIKKLDEGFDIVNTNRVGRFKERRATAFLRSIPSSIANELIGFISGIKIKDQGSGLKGFRRFVLNNLKFYGEMHRFMLAYGTVYTNKITEFDVEYKPRVYGSTAYGSLTRTFSVFLDLFPLAFFKSFSTKPFTMMPGRLFGLTGSVLFLAGCAMSLYLAVDKFLYGHDIGSRPLLIFSVMFIVLGGQFIMTGLLGELLVRIFFEATDRKPYTIRREINVD